MTVPLKVKNFQKITGPYAIKSAEVINHGDLVGIDTSEKVVVATKATGAVIKAVGIAVFTDEYAGNVVRTGNAGGTIKCSIARTAVIDGANLTSTIVPAINGGLTVYMGEAPTATVSNYTCTQTSTNGDGLQPVGFVDANLDLVLDVSSAMFKYQTSGNSVVGVV